MKVITAIENYKKEPDDIVCFLAGGMTNCSDWQSEVINALENYEFKDIIDNLVILNPRRENFPIHDSNASLEQIKWEFEMLEMCDIFSMYFSSGVSDQPICMYELGRNLVRMQQKFDDIIGRIVISVEEGYKRANDVKIQTDLAVGLRNISKSFEETDPQTHADLIVANYCYLKKENSKEYLIWRE